MAQSIPIYKRNSNRIAGFIISNLRLPNGRKVSYKAMGNNAIAEIIRRYQEDCKKVLCSESA